jgi:hypothetical protein
LQAACCLVFFAATAVYGQTAVKGKAVFKGTPARLRPISMDADPACAAKHKGPVLPETSVINKADGSLKNVFIYVSKGLEGKNYPTPKTPVVLDQSGCEYVPHVFGIMANQPFKVVNSDATTHNVHAMGQANPEFNVGQRAGAPPIVKTFTKPEVTIPILCNQHPWMRAVAHVVSNPFYAVTDANGAFTIKGLPPGKYTLTAIHEKYGTENQEITVAAGKAPAVSFTFTNGKASVESPLKMMPALVIE